MNVSDIVFGQIHLQRWRFKVPGKTNIGLSTEHVSETIFRSGNVPWFVRQEDDEFTLVGECYVHGIMDGEFTQTAHLTVQDIVLK